MTLPRSKERRSTIPLSENLNKSISLDLIRILFCDRTFEHDIYELIRAFYPDITIQSQYENDLLPSAGQIDAGTGFVVWTRDHKAFIGCSTRGERVWTCTAFLPEDGSFASGQLEKDSKNALFSCAFRAESELACDLTNTDGLNLGFHEEYFAWPEGMSAESFSAAAARKENKDRLKYCLYRLLVWQTGRTLPWGSLTGIRPAKLAMGMLEQGKKNPQIADMLRTRCQVSPAKTALAITIANREKAILDEIDAGSGYSLYVGIPFCPSICLYCSFSSSPLSAWKKKVDDYLDALCKEIDEVSRMVKELGRRLDTIYIGGGTPTTLEPEQLTRLLGKLESSFGFDTLKEFTVEAGRPDSFSPLKMKALKSFPVSRVSVNPQTMNQETLDLIGRKHTVLQTREAFAMAREAGFDDINMDIIVGLPGEDRAMVRNTLSQIRELNPESLTVHTLAVKRAARLNIFREQYQEMSYESNQEIMEDVLTAAREMGMGPYYMYRQKNMKGNFENVGYSKPGKAGLYNILIMEERQPIIALGAGGSSKLVYLQENRIERVENVKDVTNYLARLPEMIERKKKAIDALSAGTPMRCEK